MNAVFIIGISNIVNFVEAQCNKMLKISIMNQCDEVIFGKMSATTDEPDQEMPAPSAKDPGWGMSANNSEEPDIEMPAPGNEEPD